ncbi:MAG TPA: EAL domain-containing protein [Acetobacteraceae bacterium]|nr:EAL domain-containing protein [Acetobacteraceae bacterium]
MTASLNAARASGPAPKDRFVAFAFAAAELLVEAGPDGTVTYATGGFSGHYGRPAESFVGRPLAGLVGPADQAALSLGLSLLTERGRLAPMVLRLDDREATPMALAGLALPGPPPRLSLTFAKLPAAAPDGALEAPVSFVQAAEARMRSGRDGEVGLLEVQGWAEAKHGLSPEAQHALQAEVTEALQRLAGPGTVASEVSEGRYGLLAAQSLDLAALAAQLEAVIRRNPAGSRARVASAELRLAREGLTAHQAARALRFALDRFTEGGTAATSRAGFADGLAGFIATAEQRTRAMRHAIAEGRLRLAFQPIVDIGTGVAHHFEALLRPIPTPGMPIEQTQEFVTFAEAVGLSEELDAAVLDLAATAARNAPHAALAVNVSGISIQRPAFRDRMLATLTAAPGLAERMLIELTETADVEDTAAAMESVRQLRAAGIRLCIDDFGAGAASFRYLRDFEVDYVKIDGGYVRRAAASARDYGFVASMVELASLVGAATIAEMIETPEQAALMRKLGVRHGQGYLFGRPGALPGAA